MDDPRVGAPRAMRTALASDRAALAGWRRQSSGFAMPASTCDRNARSWPACASCGRDSRTPCRPSGHIRRSAAPGTCRRDRPPGCGDRALAVFWNANCRAGGLRDVVDGLAIGEAGGRGGAEREEHLLLRGADGHLFELVRRDFLPASELFARRCSADERETAPRRRRRATSPRNAAHPTYVRRVRGSVPCFASSSATNPIPRCATSTTWRSHRRDRRSFTQIMAWPTRSTVASR